MPGGGVSYAHFIGQVKSELVPTKKEEKKKKRQRVYLVAEGGG